MNNLLRQAARRYTSRAHETAIPTYPVVDAINILLNDAFERKEKRQTRWDKRKSSADKGPYRNQDETVEISVNLNVDPRKPGQALRGSFPLPHGNGKVVNLLVFASKEEDIEKAKEAGASIVGGDDLIAKIKSGEVDLNFNRTLASKDMIPKVSKELGRLLGPRGLMPTPKLGTIIDNSADVTQMVTDQLVGLVNFRAEKEGIIHAPIGKVSFGAEKIMENTRAFLNGIQDAKPDLTGKKAAAKKGKKKKSGGKGKYILRAHLGATQGKSIRLDLEYVDASSPFFMGDVIA